MTTDEAKKEEKTEVKEPEKVTFRCRSCNELKLVEDMRVITRFFPLLVVCRDCEKQIR